MELVEFKKHMGRIKKTYDIETQICDLLSCDGPIMFTDEIVDSLIDMLEEYFEDEDEWISYWVYELDFGSKWEKGMVLDENGQDIKLQTIEDLYNILMER
jgi:hypothetical protein